MEERGGGRSGSERLRSTVSNVDGINGNLTPASSVSSLSDLDNVYTDSENNEVRHSHRQRPTSRSGLAQAGTATVDDNESDQETLELSKLRCSGERTEVVAERHKRRTNRCADYPGLAFGSSIFSSNTMILKQYMF